MDEVKNKLEKERKGVKGRRESAVSKYVEDALLEFCVQDKEFAQAVLQSEKTFSDCCEYVVKGASEVLSDMEAYKRAAEFYFPGASIRFEMHIKVNPYETDEAAEAPISTAGIDTIIDITSLI